MGVDIAAWLRRNPTAILLIAVLLYIVGFSYLTILRHYAFMSTAWDLGIYEQVLWSTANTGRLFWYTPEVAINPSCNFFGMHFSPILFLVLPIYAVFQSTETLLILQVSSLALGAIPLYKLVHYETHSQKQALIFGLIYLAYPPIYGVACFDFHVQAFLPLLFISAFYYFKKQEWGKYFLFIILSLMVIEFVPLIVMFFGLYGLWVNRKEIWGHVKGSRFRELFHERGIVFPIVTIVLGIVWFIVARTITLSINPSSPPHPNWKDIGDPVHDLPGFIFNVFANPIKSLEILVAPVNQKTLYIYGLFAPLAFLSFLDLPSLMIGAPWFLVAFLSNYPPYYLPVGYQYVAFVSPFIFISAVYGAKRFLTFKNRFVPKKRFKVITGKIMRIPHWRKLAVILLVLIMGVSYVTVLGINAKIPSISEHDRLLGAFTRLVPSGASILTQNDIFPHLSKRLYGYASADFQQLLLANLNFEYVLIDTTSPWYMGSLESLVRNLTQTDSYAVQYAADGIWLLKKDYAGQTTYLVSNGTFVSFYNQGLRLKLLDNASFEGEPWSENVTWTIDATPGSNIPQSWKTKNTFALLLEGWLYAPVSGDYLFQLQSEGVSDLFLDAAEILHTNNSVVNNEVRLERGFHSARIEYAKDSPYLPLLRLLWKPPWETSIQQIPARFLYAKTQPDVSSVFSGMKWDWGSGSPFVSIDRNHYSAFANCYLYVPTSGVYKFQALTDNDMSLLIDGELVISPFEDSNKTVSNALLLKGNHEVQIEFLKFQENAHLSVLWQRPGSLQFEEISTDYLSWQGEQSD
jgi:uncharacterized membrane protein